MRRRILTLLTAAILALAIAVTPASAGGANQVVQVQNSTDGATVVRAGTQVVPVTGDSVTSTNLSSAINTTCVGCHTSAVAVQILIVRGTPSSYTPSNVAVAVNADCDSCGVYAYARQDTIQTSSDAHLSGAARQEVAQLRQQIASTAASILPSDKATDPDLTRDHELDAKLDALADQLDAVVTAGLEASSDSTTVLQDNVEVDQTTPSS